MNATQKVYCQVFSNVYALMLKTQSYHWHVTGMEFKSLHLFFEDQYQQLFEFVDQIAERMRVMGFHVPASFSLMNEFKQLSDANNNLTAHEMVNDLTRDYLSLIDNIDELMNKAKEDNDEGALSLFSDMVQQLEKNLWMCRVTTGGV
jgi:starvation-inducible DNA-binding protein